MAVAIELRRDFRENTGGNDRDAGVRLGFPIDPGADTTIFATAYATAKKVDKATMVKRSGPTGW